MDIWEANSISTAYTPHPCDTATQTICSGNACGGTYSTERYSGTCDPDGCDFNSYRLGDETFYGPGMKVNTNSVFTVVTQFITDTGTASGQLSDIKRFYLQNGVLIPNSYSTISGIPGNSVNDAYCTAEKTAFNDTNYVFEKHGGFAGMTSAFNDGMVLVLSLWDDYYANMLWLDSDYPTTDAPSTPGVARGTCSTTSGVPATVEADSPGSYVIYSNIKVGAINSTYTATTSSSGGGGTTSTSATSTTTLTTSTTSSVSTSATTVPEYGQCGGVTYTGSTVCAAGYTCVESNIYYSQCLAT